MTSLWNAMAHAVEALWMNASDRGANADAESALRHLCTSHVRLAARLDVEEAPDDDLEGANNAGAAFSDTGAGLHHKLCHVLGGMFDLPHASTHAAVLPLVVRFHRYAAPGTMVALARAIGGLDPVGGLVRLSTLPGVPDEPRGRGDAA